MLSTAHALDVCAQPRLRSVSGRGGGCLGLRAQVCLQAFEDDRFEALAALEQVCVRARACDLFEALAALEQVCLSVCVCAHTHKCVTYLRP